MATTPTGADFSAIDAALNVTRNKLAQHIAALAFLRQTLNYLRSPPLAFASSETPERSNE
jgi:hypothetical protein